MFHRRGGPAWFRSSAVAGLVLTVLAWPGVAAGDPATAEALFREGRRLLDEGRYDEACSKLAESQTQDPASGTLINLALCYEKQGRLAKAWAEYRAAAVLARKDGRSDRIATAEQKILELDARVPRLIVRAAEPRTGIEARWGTVRIGVGAFDTPIPVDPGSYAVTVTAPGYEDFTATVVVAERESKTLDVPALRPTTRAPEPRVTPAVTPPKRLPEKPPRATPRKGASIVPGLVVGGAGVLALGAGSIFGISSLDAYSDAEEECPARRGCSAAARDAREDAETKAWIANISLGAGLLATGIGAWLVLGASGESPGTVSVRVAPRPGGGELGFSTPL